MKTLFITICITAGLSAGCPRKEPLVLKNTEPMVQDDFTSPIKESSSRTPAALQNLEGDVDFAKLLAKNIKFIGSLEKEVLHLILKTTAPEVNQFEVLGYGFDKFNRLKTGFLASFGCQKLAVQQIANNYEVYSRCTKPARKLAEIIQETKERSHFKVVFLTSNWKSIHGNAAGINPDRICRFYLKDQKVQSLDCSDTVYSMSRDNLDLNLFELKLRKYSFNRNQSKELMIEGGIYKNLIENKKIEIVVPANGKISILENELKVKDDFAEMQNKLLGLEEQKEEEQKEEQKTEAPQPVQAVKEELKDEMKEELKENPNEVTNNKPNEDQTEGFEQQPNPESVPLNAEPVLESETSYER